MQYLTACRRHFPLHLSLYLCLPLCLCSYLCGCPCLCLSVSMSLSPSTSGPMFMCASASVSASVCAFESESVSVTASASADVFHLSTHAPVSVCGSGLVAACLARVAERAPPELCCVVSREISAFLEILWIVELLCDNLTC